MTEQEPEGVLKAAEFTPIEQAGHRRGNRFKAGVVVFVVMGLVALGIMLYLFMARAVIFHLTPATADVQIDGLDFNLGSNYLLLPGKRSVMVSAQGYVTARETLQVTDQETQEISIELKPLPGNLRIFSELDNIDVVIDDQAVGTAPGVIEGIEQGNHSVEFARYRYFPLKKSINIEGLGRTQDVDVVLEPAWGWLDIDSEPAGAEVFVDEKKVATTPARVEILETGSDVSIASEGYKTWRQRLTVTSGTTENYPTVALEVADGVLEITSEPLGAAITIDGKYVGVSPLKAPVSPLREHSVDFFLEGYFKASRNASVTSEQISSLAVKLKPNIGSIKLNVSPKDAVVRVNGKTMGNGSTLLSLPAKKHKLEISQAGYQSHKAVITPNPGQPQSLTVALLTNQQAYWARRPPSIRSPVGSALKLFRPSGTFTLGAPRREPGRRANESERAVRLERPFYIGLKEITNEQFREWRDTHSSTSLRGNSLDLDDQPAVMVSWQEAALFCNWLSEQAGLPLFYKVSDGNVSGFDWQATGYRLPTEAEWAWVAKIDGSGETLMFPWGGDRYPPEKVIENYADPSAVNLVSFVLKAYPDGYPVSAVVGSFEPNHNGLYDIGGNVAEWVNDYYDIQGHSGEPVIDPRGPQQGSRNVVRGASWAQGSRADLRLSARRPGVEGALDIGFRIARYVDNPKGAQ